MRFSNASGKEQEDGVGVLCPPLIPKEVHKLSKRLVDGSNIAVTVKDRLLFEADTIFFWRMSADDSGGAWRLNYCDSWDDGSAAAF